MLAGVSAGLWKSKDLEKMRQVDRVFAPAMDSARRKKLLDGWHQAVARVLTVDPHTAKKAGKAIGGVRRAAV
jgi:glycerol kinase